MKDHRNTAIGRCCAVLLAVAAALITAPGLAHAVARPAVAAVLDGAVSEGPTWLRKLPPPGPPVHGADGSHIDHTVTIDARRSTVYVYSAAMNRVVALDLIRPADTSVPRPTLYLLDGAEDGIGQDGSETSWETQTDLIPFMADKNVNVVTVLDGRYSYYTDWQSDDPVLGRNRWTTFLTNELPAVIDAAYGTDGRNAIAGVSMSATSALALAEAAPGRYRSVGSFSGCAQTGADPGRRYAQAVVLSGGGNPWNMWGVDGSPGWVGQRSVHRCQPGAVARGESVCQCGHGRPRRRGRDTRRGRHAGVRRGRMYPCVAGIDGSGGHCGNLPVRARRTAFLAVLAAVAARGVAGIRSLAGHLSSANRLPASTGRTDPHPARGPRRIPDQTSGPACGAGYGARPGANTLETKGFR